MKTRVMGRMDYHTHRLQTLEQWRSWLAGGLLGSLLRASGTTNRPTLSKQTIVDVIVGGLTGLIIPDEWLG